MEDGPVPDWNELLALPPITDIALNMHTTLPYSFGVSMEYALRELNILRQNEKTPPVLTIIPMHPTDLLPDCSVTIQTSKHRSKIICAEWLLQRWCLHGVERRQRGYELFQAQTFMTDDQYQDRSAGYMATLVNMALQTLSFRMPTSVYW